MGVGGQPAPEGRAPSEEGSPGPRPDVEVAPGVFEIQLPLPYRLAIVNAYLLRERDGFTLIDCGLRTEESWTAMRDALQVIGCRIDQIRRILVTHIHPDHFGLAARLRQAAGAQLYLHRLEVALMEPRYADVQQLLGEVARWLEVNGCPADEREFVTTASMAAREFVTVVQPDVLLEGAEALPLDDSVLRVLWTPGHSPGHICLYDPRRRYLFAGDHLLPKISSNVGLHPQSGANPLDDYLDSLDRVAALPVERVFPAHGPVFDRHGERVRELLRHHAQRKDAIVEQLGPHPRTGWEVAVELFGVQRNAFEKRLALQETLAHLQSLAQAGRLVKSLDFGRVWWRAAVSPPP